MYLGTWWPPKNILKLSGRPVLYRPVMKNDFEDENSNDYAVMNFEEGRDFCQKKGRGN